MAQHDNVKLYEAPEMWTREYDPEVYEKKRVFQAIVPPDVQTVLDVGCGDGAITNGFWEGGVVIGCDRSQSALAKVRAPKVLASCDALPFPDNTFDLVLCSEVLEHLPDSLYGKALAEIARVTSSSVLISVPYREVLAQRSVRCPECGAKYHLNGHVRRFIRPDDVLKGFPGFRLAFVGLVGLQHGGDPVTPSWFVKLRRRLLKESPADPIAICPVCSSKAPEAAHCARPRLTWVLDRIDWRVRARPLFRWMVLRLDRLSSPPSAGGGAV